MEVTSDPILKIPTRTSILAVEFSPYEWSKSLLAVALPSSIAVYSIKFKEESDDVETSIDQIWESHVDSEPLALAWSPAATLHSSPRCLQLLVATDDHKVLELTSNLSGTDTVTEQCRHDDYINNVVYSGDSGELAASAGDDLVVKVWRPDTTDIIAKFLLTSPGVSVKFNPEDVDILMVGERGGTIRLYSISKGCATLALFSPGPLLATDWSESSVLVATGPKSLSVWSLTSQQPLRETIAIGDNLLTNVKLCKSSEGLVATVSNPHVLRVSHLQANRVPMVVNLKVISGMSWHLQTPYLAVGSDRKVLIWKIDNV